MSNTKTGGRAFPVVAYDRHGEIMDIDAGMTLRDYFAAKAMPIAFQQYIQSCGAITDWHDIGGSLSFVTGDAYRLADAMLAARSA